MAVDVGAAPPHGSRIGGGSRSEYLDLLRMYRELLRAERRQLLHVRFGASRMGGHEVVREILVAMHPPAGTIEHILEI